MRITDLHIQGFGIWSGLRLGDLPETLTVFYAPNEAGKTTILQFLRGMLYGLATGARTSYLPPAHGEEAGGALQLVTRHGIYRLERVLRRSADGSWDEHMKVHAGDQRPAGAHVVRNALGGIDERTFNNVFAVGLAELQELGTLSDTAAAQQLYGLASGRDRVSLADVTARLDQMAAALFHCSEHDASSDGKPAGAIDRLVRRHRQLTHRLRQIESAAPQYLELQKKRREVTEQIEALQGKTPGPVNDRPWDQYVLSLEQQWNRFCEATRQLRDRAEKPIPEGAIHRLEELERNIDQVRKELAANKQRRQTLRAELDSLGESTQLAVDLSRFDHIAARRNDIESLERQIQELQSSLEELELELQTALERHGVDATSLDASQMRPGLFRALRQPARLAFQRRQLWRDLRSQVRHYSKQAEQIGAQHQAALAELGVEQVDDACRAAQEKVARLRQLLTLQADLQRATRQLGELEQQTDAWHRCLPLPLRWRLLLWAAFWTGILMMLAALFDGWLGLAEGWSVPMTWVGLCMSLASTGAKKGAEWWFKWRIKHSERVAARWRRQQDDLQRQWESLQKGMPAEFGSWEQQLERAESELERIEQLRPMEAARLESLEWAAAARQQADHARAQWIQACRAWRRALRAAGLPDTLSPPRVRRMVRDEPLRTARRKIEQVRAELAEQQAMWKQTTRELAVLREFVRLREGVDLDSGLPLADQIELIADVVQRFRHQCQRVDQTRQCLDDAMSEKQSLHAQLEKAKQKIDQLVARFDTESSDALRTRYHQQQELAQLAQQRDQYMRDVAAALGNAVTVEAIEHQLAGDADQTVPRLLKEAGSTHLQSQTQLARLHEQLGGVSERLRQCSADRQRARTLAAIGDVEAQLQRALRHWITLKQARTILDHVRTSYEYERQPETLAEASGYLRQLTAGRYRRIWTPLGEPALRAEMADGTSLAMEQLSRGAREQVYLSLRLALAADFARRGAVLPIILDDIFVNFDTARARCAVRTIYDFASQGRQVLVFTCHEHIRDAFVELDADVRSLPDARRLGQGEQVSSDAEQVEREAAGQPGKQASPPAEPNGERPVESSPLRQRQQTLRRRPRHPEERHTRTRRLRPRRLRPRRLTPPAERRAELTREINPPLPAEPTIPFEPRPNPHARAHPGSGLVWVEYDVA